METRKINSRNFQIAVSETPARNKVGFGGTNPVGPLVQGNAINAVPYPVVRPRFAAITMPFAFTNDNMADVNDEVFQQLTQVNGSFRGSNLGFGASDIAGALSKSYAWYALIKSAIQIYRVMISAKPTWAKLGSQGIREFVSRGFAIDANELKGRIQRLVNEFNSVGVMTHATKALLDRLFDTLHYDSPGADGIPHCIWPIVRYNIGSGTQAQYDIDTILNNAAWDAFDKSMPFSTAEALAAGWIRSYCTDKMTIDFMDKPIDCVYDSKTHAILLNTIAGQINGIAGDRNFFFSSAATRFDDGAAQNHDFYIYLPEGYTMSEDLDLIAGYDTVNPANTDTTANRMYGIFAITGFRYLYGGSGQYEQVDGEVRIDLSTISQQDIQELNCVLADDFIANIYISNGSDNMEVAKPNSHLLVSIMEEGNLNRVDALYRHLLHMNLSNREYKTNVSKKSQFRKDDPEKA